MSEYLSYSEFMLGTREHSKTDHVLLMAISRLSCLPGYTNKSPGQIYDLLVKQAKEVCDPLEKPPIRWNPYNKVVLDHRDGTIDPERTNAERAARGLPVPWNPGIGEEESRLDPVF